MPLLPCFKLVFKYLNLDIICSPSLVNGLKSKDVKRLGVKASSLREIKVKVIVLNVGTNTPSIIGKSRDNVFRVCPTMNVAIRGRSK
jgi:hypothetical protein